MPPWSIISVCQSTTLDGTRKHAGSSFIVSPEVLRKDLAAHASRKTTELEDAERHHVAILQKRLAEEEEKTAALEKKTAALEKDHIIII